MDRSNLANIALKGILGVKAMAEIAHALGGDSDAAEYGVSALIAVLKHVRVTD